MATTERIYPCPRCRKPVLWDENNKARPFCSERCQMIDFGSWMNEEHRIPGEQGMDDVERDAEPDS